MGTRNAKAVWVGELKSGKGTLALGSGAAELPYSFKTRFEDGHPGSNPEELIGAAHAGCFSMALAHMLSQAGHPPHRIETTAEVQIAAVKDGFAIPAIELSTRATVPGIDDARFQELADKAKRNCPVSKALAGVEITLRAELDG